MQGAALRDSPRCFFSIPRFSKGVYYLSHARTGKKVPINESIVCIKPEIFLIFVIYRFTFNGYREGVFNQGDLHGGKEAARSRPYC